MSGIVEFLDRYSVLKENDDQPDKSILSLYMSNGEHICCLKWGNRYLISKDEILKMLIFAYKSVNYSLDSMSALEQCLDADLSFLIVSKDYMECSQDSEILLRLLSHGGVKSSKSQNVYFWPSIVNMFCKKIEQQQIPLSKLEIIAGSVSGDATSSSSEFHYRKDLADEFGCTFPGCGISFKRIQHLKRHFISHTNHRAFVCAQCKSQFSRLDNLNAHLRKNGPLCRKKRTLNTPPVSPAPPTTSNASNTRQPTSKIPISSLLNDEPHD